ncbi:MAG: hypothetical protein ACOC33_03080 [bacterium]
MKRYGTDIYNDFLKTKKKLKSLENEINKRLNFLLENDFLSEKMKNKINSLNLDFISSEQKLDIILEIEKEFVNSSKQLNLF